MSPSLQLISSRTVLSSVLEPHRVPSFCHKRFLVLRSNLAHTDAYVTPCSLSAVHFHATTRDSDVKQCSYLKQNNSVCRVTFELYKRKSWHIRQAVSNTSVRHGRTLCNNNDRARVTRALYETTGLYIHTRGMIIIVSYLSNASTRASFVFRYESAIAGCSLGTLTTCLIV
jgi:hypothetical protein